MKISEIYNLGKNQAELDFINIDIEKDTPLFLDPFFLSKRTDKWSMETNRTIKSYFQRVLDLIQQNSLQDARLLFQHLSEPNSTCLGMSKGVPRGRGVGNSFSDEIYERILASHAAQTGLIQDLQDNILFIEGFGKDRLSDMTTNLITKHLIEYTEQQCRYHEIPLQNDVPSGFYWDRQTMSWIQTYENILVIDDRKILLVPKGIVSFSKSYTPENYYNHFVLNFMQSEQIILNTVLVSRRKDGTPFVTKQDLKEEFPLSKQFLAEFSARNPDVLRNFRDESIIYSLSNHEITDININNLIRHLKSELSQIPPGRDNATNYHKLIKGILEVIFYPHLIYPTLENEIHDGRKRIDITFDNAARDGIFYRLSNAMGIPCQYIMIECKNYSGDPVNPELDQLSGRFSPNRGKVGFLLCREINNLNLFINRCRDTYRDERGLIIPITDEDINTILDNYNDWDNSFIDRFVADRIRLITVN